MIATIIICVLLLTMSVTVNAVFIWYVRKLISTVYFGLESSSEIFIHLNDYRKHLKSIYELELFYGDKNLKEVIQHTTHLLRFLGRYDAVDSFIRPEIKEIILEEDNDEEEKEETLG